MKRTMQTSNALLPFILAAFIAPVPIAPRLSAAPAGAPPERKPGTDRTYCSFDRPVPADKAEVYPPGLIKFQDTDLQEVLKIYQTVSGRTVIRSASLPSVAITLESNRSLTRLETLQLLDTVLAQAGVTMIPQGDSYMKAVPPSQAPSESAPIPNLTPEQLPESLSYMTYIVELKGVKANSIVHVLAPFSKSPNSLLIVPDADLLILRDYSANIRRMLHVLDRVEKASKLRQGRDEAPGVDRIPAP